MWRSVASHGGHEPEKRRAAARPSAAAPAPYSSQAKCDHILLVTFVAREDRGGWAAWTPLLEEIEDDARARVGDRQGLDTELLLNLQGL